MPRIKGFLPEQKVEYQRQLLADRCSLMLFKAGLNMSDVARFLDISPQAVSQQFKTKSITTSVLIAVFTLADASSEEIANTMKVRD